MSKPILQKILTTFAISTETIVCSYFGRHADDIAELHQLFRTIQVIDVGKPRPRRRRKSFFSPIFRLDEDTSDSRRQSNHWTRIQDFI